MNKRLVVFLLTALSVSLSFAICAAEEHKLWVPRAVNALNSGNLDISEFTAEGREIGIARTLFASGSRSTRASATEGKPHAAVAQMKAYCDALDRYTTGNLLGRVFLQDAPQKPWRERTSSRDEARRPFREATVWFRNGSPELVVLSEPINNQCDAYVKFYFRPNGTLVKRRSAALGIKGNHTIVMQSEYFDQNGNRIYVNTIQINTQTLREKAVKKLPFTPPYYRAIKDLPFSHFFSHAKSR